MIKGKNTKRGKRFSNNNIIVYCRSITSIENLISHKNVIQLIIIETLKWVVTLFVKIDSNVITFSSKEL